MERDRRFLEQQLKENQGLLSGRDRLIRTFVGTLANLEGLKGYNWYDELVKCKQSCAGEGTFSLSQVESLLKVMKNELFRKSLTVEDEKESEQRSQRKDDYAKEQQIFNVGQTREILYQKIQHLIAEINLPNYDRINQKSEKFLQDFLTNFSLERLDTYLEKVVELLQELKFEYQIKRAEIDAFLHELIRKLLETEQEFILHFESAQDRQKDNNRAFESFLTDQLNDLGKTFESISEGDEWGRLKQDILGSLDGIRVKIEEKSKEEESEFLTMQQQLDQVKEKLNDTQNELEELKKRSELIEKEILLDGLTGVFNRRAFDQKIKEMVLLYQRYQESFSLIMLDVDYFKRINDKYGHRVGDNALMRIVKNIREIIREVDFLGRYGGEEFVLLLPHIDGDQALIVAEKIRLAIEKITFTYKRNELIKITLSAGVAVICLKDTEDSLIQRADKALYLAKNSGRNLVRSENDLK